MKVEIDKDKDNYDKIKHLVEVDCDIFAVFVLMANQIGEMYIASDSHLDSNYFRALITNLDLIEDYKNDRIKKFNSNKIGSLKWIVTEYDNLRLLRIIETDKTIFVLTKSKTRLENTVENILGYYYDLDDIPKSLF